MFPSSPFLYPTPNPSAFSNSDKNREVTQKTLSEVARTKSASSCVLRKRPAPSSDSSDSLKLAEPFKRRKILNANLNLTPSITATEGAPAHDKDLVATKAVLRIIGHYIDAVVQSVLKCRMQRGKTVLQGSKGSNGNHACHYSLSGNMLDNSFQKTVEGIIERGISSPHTEKYLAAKGIKTPQRKEIHENHTDPQLVASILKETISPGKQRSCFKGTQYGLNRNATIELPKESNQLDSLLERVIRPFEESLEEERAAGKITPKESTEKLIDQLLIFYEKSILANEARILDIERYSDYELIVQNFHEKIKALPKNGLKLVNPFTEYDLFAEYIDAVNGLLECKESLLTTMTGTHSFREIKERRRDYSLLKDFIKFVDDGNNTKDAFDYYIENIFPYLKEVADVDVSPARYELYLKEAKFQNKAVLDYVNQNMTDQAEQIYFGTSEKEVTEKVYEIIKLLSPEKDTPSKDIHFKSKKELVFDSSNKENSNENPLDIELALT